MRRLLLTAITLAFAAGSTVSAAPCRNDKGKFITCPPAAAKKCRDAKGKFIKCEATPATPS
jgi:hypothetical protein